MRRLRQAGNQPPCTTFGWACWQPADEGAHHCRWDVVLCDSEGHIVRIALAGHPDSAKAASTAPDLTTGPSAGAARDGGNSSAGSGGSSAAAAAPAAGSGPHGLLLPELARLQRLRSLIFEHCNLAGSLIPAEWGQPGAFPALTR